MRFKPNLRLSIKLSVGNALAADRTTDKVDKLLRKLLKLPKMGGERDDIRSKCADWRAVIACSSMVDALWVGVFHVVHGGRDLDIREFPSK